MMSTVRRLGDDMGREWLNDKIKEYNVIVVLNSDRSKVLVCKRRKDPFIGKYNFVGGKVKNGETGMQAAHRELYEETSITSSHIRLVHLLDIGYKVLGFVLQVYVGVLKDEGIEVVGTENELAWKNIDGTNFSDTSLYAGNGVMDMILKEIEYDSDLLQRDVLAGDDERGNGEQQYG